MHRRPYDLKKIFFSGILFTPDKDLVFVYSVNKVCAVLKSRCLCYLITVNVRVGKSRHTGTHWRICTLPLPTICLHFWCQASQIKGPLSAWELGAVKSQGWAGTPLCKAFEIGTSLRLQVTVPCSQFFLCCLLNCCGWEDFFFFFAYHRTNTNPVFSCILEWG